MSTPNAVTCWPTFTVSSVRGVVSPERITRALPKLPLIVKLVLNWKVVWAASLLAPNTTIGPSVPGVSGRSTTKPSTMSSPPPDVPRPASRFETSMNDAPGLIVPIACTHVPAGFAASAATPAAPVEPRPSTWNTVFASNESSVSPRESCTTVCRSMVENIETGVTVIVWPWTRSLRPSARSTRTVIDGSNVAVLPARSTISDWSSPTSKSTLWWLFCSAVSGAAVRSSASVRVPASGTPVESSSAAAAVLPRRKQVALVKSKVIDAVS